MPFEFMNNGHLGGYIRSTREHPHGDPATYCVGVWEYLRERINPLSVLDIGCGEGHAVKWWLERGVACMGVEGMEEAFRAAVVPRSRLMLHDFTRGPAPFSGFVKRVDLVWSCEFVEHVEEQFLENFLKAFDYGKWLAITHAGPGQPGYHHVNCQPRRYWVDILERRGFAYDEAVTLEARKRDPDTHFGRAGLIFRK